MSTPRRPTPRRPSVESLEDRRLPASLLALSTANELLSIESARPDQVLRTTPIVGLQPSEIVLGLDVRPATGQLYGLGSTARLYRINPTTGAATQVGPRLATNLSGGDFGFDFDPVSDRARVVSDANQNVLIHPDTAEITIDANLFFQNPPPGETDPEIVAIGHVQSSLPGLASVPLFAIDARQDTLMRLGMGAGDLSASRGVLFPVGPLGVDTTGLVGLDLDASNTAFAALNTRGAATSGLYTIDTDSGSATLIGTIGGGRPIRDITAVPLVDRLYAATTGNRLLTFSANTPETIERAVPILGLRPGETIVALDVSGIGDALQALTSANALVYIDPPTGAVSLPTNLSVDLGPTPGFDAIPGSLRLRVVTPSNQNLVVFPSSSSVEVQVPLAYAAGDPNAAEDPRIVASAYDNASAGTTLFGIDSARDILVTQGSRGCAISPDTGQLFTVGSLGVNTGGALGFDIAPNGRAFAVFSPPDESAGPFNRGTLHTIDLTTGRALPIGEIGGGEGITGLAVAPRGFFQFATSIVFVPELTREVRVEVRRVGGMAGAATIDFATADRTATAGADYVATSGTLSFADGETSKTITVVVRGDDRVEPDEAFDLRLSNPTGGVGLSRFNVLPIVIQSHDFDQIGPMISNVGLLGPGRAIDGIEVRFDELLDPTAARDPGHYTVSGRLSNGRAVAIPLASVEYEDLSYSVRLRPARPFSLARLREVHVLVKGDSGLIDLRGNGFDGDFDGTPGGNFQVRFRVARGRTVRYTDANGDLVTLSLVGPGTIELTRRPDGEGHQVWIIGASPGRSALRGTVRRGRRGDGRTTLVELVGTGRVNVSHLIDSRAFLNFRPTAGLSALPFDPF